MEKVGTPEKKSTPLRALRRTVGESGGRGEEVKEGGEKRGGVKRRGRESGKWNLETSPEDRVRERAEGDRPVGPRIPLGVGIERR